MAKLILKKLCNKRNVSHKTLSRRRFAYGFCVVVVVVRRKKVVTCTECNYAKCSFVWFLRNQKHCTYLLFENVRYLPLAITLLRKGNRAFVGDENYAYRTGTAVCADYGTD